MKRSELYQKTVDILSQAYFNDTLISGNCQCCACGNLIAAANGYKIEKLGENVEWFNKHGEVVKPKWDEVFVTTNKYVLYPVLPQIKQITELANFVGTARHQIESTGYSVQELAMIEFAFEKGFRGKDKMFNALMAVVDVLDKIHDNNDTAVAAKSKQRFQK